MLVQRDSNSPTKKKKKGGRKEGEKQEEGKRKGKKNKRREKKKSQHFTLNHLQRVIYIKYLTDLNIGAKTRKLYKKTGVNIHDNNLQRILI